MTRKLRARKRNRLCIAYGHVVVQVIVDAFAKSFRQFPWCYISDPLTVSNSFAVSVFIIPHSPFSSPTKDAPALIGGTFQSVGLNVRFRAGLAALFFLAKTVQNNILLDVLTDRGA